MYYIQRDIASAMSALSDIGAFIYERKSSDPDLDELSTQFGDGMQLLSVALLALSDERRKALSKVLKPQAYDHLTATLSKRDRPEALFGGNVTEAMREYDAAKKASKSLSKEQKKPTQKPKKFQAQNQSSGQKSKFIKSNRKPSHTASKPTAAAQQQQSPKAPLNFQKQGQRQ